MAATAAAARPRLSWFTRRSMSASARSKRTVVASGKLKPGSLMSVKPLDP
jgi:hypothetical protein